MIYARGVLLALIATCTKGFPLTKRISQTIQASTTKWEAACRTAGGDQRCNPLAVEAFQSLLAAAGPCAQQDNADKMIDLATYLKNDADMIKFTQIFVQQPRNTPNSLAVPYCQKDPKNLELKGLFQCQFQGANQKKFIGDLGVGAPGTIPFGRDKPLDPPGSCSAHPTGPIPDGSQLIDIPGAAPNANSSQVPTSTKGSTASPLSDAIPTVEVSTFPATTTVLYASDVAKTEAPITTETLAPTTTPTVSPMTTGTATTDMTSAGTDCPTTTSTGTDSPANTKAAEIDAPTTTETDAPTTTGTECPTISAGTDVLTTIKADPLTKAGTDTSTITRTDVSTTTGADAPTTTETDAPTTTGMDCQTTSVGTDTPTTTRVDAPTTAGTDALTITPDLRETTVTLMCTALEPSATVTFTLSPIDATPPADPSDTIPITSVPISAPSATTSTSDVLSPAQSSTPTSTVPSAFPDVPQACATKQKRDIDPNSPVQELIAQPDLPAVAKSWQDLCFISGGDIETDAPCVKLAGLDGLNALLAGADPCAQHDNADKMIDFAKSPGVKNKDALVANAIAYRKHPRNAVDVGGGLIPSTPYCTKAPRNSELKALANEQLNGVNPGLFGGPNFPVVAFGAPGTCPFGQQPDVDSCSCK